MSRKSYNKKIKSSSLPKKPSC